MQLLTTLPGRESCMLNAHCHFYAPEHGCCIEGSVSNFSARVGGDAYSLGVAFSTVCLELPDGVSIHHAGTTTICSFGRCRSTVWNASGRGCCVRRSSRSSSQPKTSNLPRPHTERGLLHCIFRACYRHQIDADIISILVKRHCRCGRQSERSCSSCLGQTIKVANMQSFRKQTNRKLRQQEVGWQGHPSHESVRGGDCVRRLLLVTALLPPPIRRGRWRRPVEEHLSTISRSWSSRSHGLPIPSCSRG